MKNNERDLNITAAVSRQEADYIRAFCAQFDENMMDILRCIILDGIDNADIVAAAPVYQLAGKRYMVRTTPRSMQGPHRDNGNS